MEKLIITVALTGNVPTKTMNPNLPTDPDEIAEDVRKCAAAGACLFHVHARDSEERPSLDINIYKEIVGKIKQIAPEVIIQLSTGAHAGKDWQVRANPVMLLPEMGSFTTGSNNLAGIIYENPPQFLEFLAKVYQENNVKPEIEVFETGMINNAIYLQKKGLLKAPLHFNFVLGAAGSMPATPKNVLFLSESIPHGSTWSVAGIGKAQIPMAVCAILMGGHVRIGLEDNIYMADGTPASNVQLVEKVVSIAREIGRDIADPDQARAILSLSPTAKNRVMNTISIR